MVFFLFFYTFIFSYHCHKIYKNPTRFCNWSISGLNANGTNTLDDHFLIKEIQEQDIVISAETHIGYSTHVFLNNLTGCLYVEMYRQMDGII